MADGKSDDGFTGFKTAAAAARRLGELQSAQGVAGGCVARLAEGTYAAKLDGRLYGKGGAIRAAGGG